MLPTDFRDSLMGVCVQARVCPPSQQNESTARAESLRACWVCSADLFSDGHATAVALASVSASTPLLTGKACVIAGGPRSNLGPFCFGRRPSQCVAYRVIINRNRTLQLYEASRRSYPGVARRDR
jgi:hypothetical protein